LDAFSRGSERPAGDHAIQLEDEEEIEGWGTIERLQRQLDMANLGLVLAGTVVMAVSIIAWDRFWCVFAHPRPGNPISQPDSWSCRRARQHVALGWVAHSPQYPVAR
jgi:hypothetical protein